MSGKRYGILILWVVLVVPFLFTCSGCIGEMEDYVVREDAARGLHHKKPQESGSYMIYLITMDQVSNYWQHIDEGCRKAVKEIGGIDYHWVAPTKNNVEKQKACIEQAVADGADAILLSACSVTELEESLEKVSKAGIRLIYVDSAASHDAIATLVTDNRAAGRLAAKTMKQALAEEGILKGTIGIITGSPNSRNARMRDTGFREGFRGTDFIVAPTVAHHGNRKNVEDEIRDHPEYVAFFGGNEQVTQIICRQVMESGSGQIIVGFDTSDFTLSMIQKGVIYATMQQKPEQMGYDGIQIAVEELSGNRKYDGTVIDMGVNVITKEKI